MPPQGRQLVARTQAGGLRSPATIPAGSFTQTPQGTFTFGGVIQGVLLAATLTPTAGNSYAFGIAGAGAPNLPNANPVTVRLAIGNNGGNTSVNATFLQ